MLKWLTLALFAYVAVAFTAHVPWNRALLGALLATLQACLGLSFDPARRLARFTRQSLDAVSLLNLEVGGARINVELRRVGDEVAMNVTHHTGDIQAVLMS